MEHPDVIIAGGGLAGLAAGIHLAKCGRDVAIIEKSSYPVHKVCGEYLSNEILPYLEWLGIRLQPENSSPINNFIFSDVSGHSVSAALPMGGISISRYKLDEMLYNKALEHGCTIIKDTVKDISYAGGVFTVSSGNASLTSGVVLGAFGKWSNIDKALHRGFALKRSSWLAVKGHYKGDFPEGTVALYNFPGGYCGVSKVEDDTINICYLAEYTGFKKYKSIPAYEEDVLFKNKKLRDIMAASTMVFDKPVTISQLGFEKKEAVKDHILMIGDSAGLIHPLCGNGMAMAIHSAKIGATLSNDFLAGKISREQMELSYSRLWKKQFGRRMAMGRLLADVIAKPLLAKPLFSLLKPFPALLRFMIRQTHGKPVAA